MGTNRGKALTKGLKTRAEVSKLLKVAPEELKEFEAEGLFEFVDKGRKAIDEENIEKIRVAMALKRDLGVNVAGIEVILNMREKMFRMRQDMNTLLVQIRHKLGEKLDEKVKSMKKQMD